MIKYPFVCQFHAFFGRLEGVETVGRKTFIDKNFKGVQQAHYSILQHLAIMTPLLNKHLSIIRAESNGRSDNWIMREHKCGLTAWLLALLKYPFYPLFILDNGMNLISKSLTVLTRPNYWSFSHLHIYFGGTSFLQVFGLFWSMK